MATFNINCPHCGETLEVQDEWAEMETTCPFCEKAFVIPRRETPPLGQGRRATPPPPPPPPPVRSLATGGYSRTPAGNIRESTGESEAMRLANRACHLSVLSLIVSLFWIFALIDAIRAFVARTEAEKIGWGPSTVNFRALTAIILPLVVLLIVVIIVMLGSIMR